MLPGTGDAASVRGRWIAVGIVLGLAVPGSLVMGWESSVRGSPTLPHKVVVEIGSPHYATILCNGVRPEYFENLFPISSLSGTLLTSEFTVAIHTVADAAIPPDGTAPAPTPELPCGAPTPTGWYVFLSQGTAGAVATYPTPSPGFGPSVWSNSTSAPTALVVDDEFVFMTVADFTGSGDYIAAVGNSGFNITLAGDTTFVPFHNP
jgi:hypothetical protein